MLFTFPSRYSFTIDHNTYLALVDPPCGGFSSPTCFPQDFTSLMVLELKTILAYVPFVYRAITVYGTAFQLFQLGKNHTVTPDCSSVTRRYTRDSPLVQGRIVLGSQPRLHIGLGSYSDLAARKRYRFGLFPFRSPLLRECSKLQSVRPMVGLTDYNSPIVFCSSSY